MSNSPYSFIQHLSEAVFFSEWKQSFIVAFTAYFDASGHEEDPQMEVVSVAGFVAPSEVWNEFETKWKERIGQDGLQTFHMSACANLRYAFEGWQDLKRQRLLQDLINLIKPLSRKFGCTIPSKEYKAKLEETLRQQFNFTAYVIAGRACAARVREWTHRDTSPHIANVQFFFESGDKWQPELRERLLADGFPEPIFKPKNDRYSTTGTLIELGLVPFQAADMLAYIIFLAEKFYRRNTDNWGDKESIHWMLEELLTAVEGQVNRFTLSDLQGLNVLMRASSVDLLQSTTAIDSASLSPASDTH